MDLTYTMADGEEAILRCPHCGDGELRDDADEDGPFADCCMCRECEHIFDEDEIAAAIRRAEAA